MTETLMLVFLIKGCIGHWSVRDVRPLGPVICNRLTAQESSCELTQFSLSLAAEQEGLMAAFLKPQAPCGQQCRPSAKNLWERNR
jgi:hypothetical protein